MTEGTTTRPRDVMPGVWDQLGEYRRLYGDAHVRKCIERGMAGEPDWFYAFEGGRVVGTPFTSDVVARRCVELAVMLGGRFAVVIRPAANPHVGVGKPADVGEKAAR